MNSHVLEISSFDLNGILNVQNSSIGYFSSRVSARFNISNSTIYEIEALGMFPPNGVSIIKDTVISKIRSSSFMFEAETVVRLVNVIIEYCAWICIHHLNRNLVFNNVYFGDSYFPLHVGDISGDEFLIPVYIDNERYLNSCSTYQVEKCSRAEKGFYYEKHCQPVNNTVCNLEDVYETVRNNISCLYVINKTYSKFSIIKISVLE